MTEQPRQPTVLLTVPQVAERLSLSKSATWELVMSGRIKSLQINRSRRVAVEDVDRFVAELRAG